MNIETHKTIRVEAILETSLYTTINVPIEVTDDALWEYIRDGNICGGKLTEEDSWGSSDWRWQEPYEVKFEEDAEDYSSDFK